MNGIVILRAEHSADKAQWMDLWTAWPGREVFAHPDYVALFCRADDRALCVTYRSPTGGILLPFIIRPLAVEPWAKQGPAAFDLTSPYGYGGPYCFGEVSAVERARFFSEFEQWAQEHAVVTSFVRMSLFDDSVARPPWNVVDNASNIVRSLDLTQDQLWFDYEHKVRKNVKRAQRSGLTVELDDTSGRLDAFLDIYYATMDRRDASASYYFERSFFQRITTSLSKSFIFAHVLDGKRVVSTELVLVSAEHVYSFLGGTLPDAFANRPNDLLKHEVIRWATGAGKSHYVLGGGYGGEDGIFKYKKTFAPHGVMTFRLATQVHDQALFDQLVALRRAHEGTQGKVWEPTLGYFPVFRG